MIASAAVKEPKPIYEIQTRKVKVRVGWKIQCEQCGETFTSKRSDARTCSDACRAAAYYERKRKR